MSPATPLPSTTNPTPTRIPKRIILRMRTSDFSANIPAAYNDIIAAYLTFAGHSPSEWLPECRHHAHIEPCQAPGRGQTSFHIVLDIEKDLLVVDRRPNWEGVPHEMYRVGRNGEGRCRIRGMRSVAEERRFLKVVRGFTDVVYAWGKGGRA